MGEMRRDNGFGPEDKNKQKAASSGKPRRSRKQKRKRYQGPGCMYQMVNMTVSIVLAGLIGIVIVEVLMMHR